MATENSGSSGYALNDAARLDVIKIGVNRTPIIVIDDALCEGGAAIRDRAAQAQFQDDVSLYPGVRAALPKEYVFTVLHAVRALLYRVYDIPSHYQLKPLQGCYSLITLPESELKPLQRIPHFDSSYPYRFALLHYLAEGPHGDTGFFRHRPTGYERVAEPEAQTYFDSASAYFDQYGQAEAEYIKGSAGQFELYDCIEYKPNRLVVYPGNLLHSTLVNVELDVNPDIVDGRLTANVFFEFS